MNTVSGRGGCSKRCATCLLQLLRRKVICHITGPGSSEKVLDVPVVGDRLINGGICRLCFC